MRAANVKVVSGPNAIAVGSGPTRRPPRRQRAAGCSRDHGLLVLRAADNDLVPRVLWLSANRHDRALGVCGAGTKRALVSQSLLVMPEHFPRARQSPQTRR